MPNLLSQITATLQQRENNYDHPSRNFERIAAYWNTYLESKLNKPITPEDVAMLMILMKVAREQHKHNDDNLVDIVGYAVCADKIIEYDQNTKEKPK